MGGMPEGTADMNTAQPMDDDQLVEGILQELVEGSSLADINYKLVQSGVPQQKAQMLLGQVATFLQQQKQSEAQQLEDTAEDNPEVQEAAAQAQSDADAVEQEAYNTKMQQMYADSEEGTSDNTDVDVQPIMKYGGLPSKKAFIKSYVSSYKKQEGGDTFNNSTDIPDGREAHLQKFLGAVKSTANDAVLKEQAEKAYEQSLLNQQMNPFQMGGFTNEQSGLYKFFGGGDDTSINQSDIDYTDSKNTADPYFKKGGYLPKAILGTAQNTYGVIDTNKKPEPVEQQVQQQQKGYPLYEYPTFIDPTRLNRGFINPFGQLFNYQKSWMKPVGGNRSFEDINFGPNSNIQSISDIKLRRSGMPKSFTINYKSAPGSTEANPAFDFMLSKYTASKEKQAETPKSNGAPTGPRVSPDADMYDGLNVRQAKKLARYFQTPDENLKRDLMFQNPMVTDQPENFSEPIEDSLRMSYQMPTQGVFNPSTISRDQGQNIRDTRFDFQMPTQPIDDSGFAAPVDWHDQIRFQYPNVVDDQEYMYGGYYAYGGNLPKYQTGVTDTKGSAVEADPKMQPNLNKYAQTAIDNLTKIPSRRDIGAGVGALEPRKATESNSIVDDEGLVNVGNTPKAELESKTQSQKVKVKNEYDIDPQTALNIGNAAANTGLGMIERFQDAKANNKQLARYMSDNLNASEAHTNRGTYDTNSGLFRPDQMGFTGVAAYGGMFEYGGSYQEGGEAYMTQDEIDDFIANGGELEYLND